MLVEQEPPGRAEVNNSVHNMLHKQAKCGIKELLFSAVLNLPESLHWSAVQGKACRLSALQEGKGWEP